MPLLASSLLIFIDSRAQHRRQVAARLTPRQPDYGVDFGGRTQSLIGWEGERKEEETRKGRERGGWVKTTVDAWKKSIVSACSLANVRTSGFRIKKSCHLFWAKHWDGYGAFVVCCMGEGGWAGMIMNTDSLQQDYKLCFIGWKIAKKKEMKWALAVTHQGQHRCNRKESTQRIRKKTATVCLSLCVFRNGGSRRIHLPAKM